MAIFNRASDTTATNSERSESVTLTAQLGDVLRELNDLRARRAGLTATAETDEAYSQLAAMGAQIDVLVAKETRLRAAIEVARQGEHAAEVAKAFEGAATIGDKAIQAIQAGAELTQVIAGVWPAVRKLIELDDAFRAAVPVRPPDWDEHAFTRDLLSLILAELYVASDGRLRGPTGLLQSPHQLAQNPLFTISGALREHLAMGFKGRPNPQRDGLIAAQEQSGGEPAEQGE